MKKTAWWKETFGAEYGVAFRDFYGPDKTASEVAFLRRHAGLKAGMRVLDVPCGQGRHTVALARLGYAVTGIDFSSVLVAEAKRAVRQEGVKAVIRRGDMRRMTGSGKYEMAITLGNSFGYFSDDDNQRVLMSISRHLVRGGVLVLDLPNTVGLVRNPLGSSVHRFAGGHIATSAYAFDPLSMRLKIKWEIAVGKKMKRTAGEIRLYTAPEISGMLARAGLHVASVFGNFGGHPYNLESPRLIVLAKKMQ